jgi:ppGpp synthetase/RelA/SpoT-type nucleotidyltranferase/Tfp pilus assembly protein PilF
MTDKEDELQIIYKNNLPAWEKILNDISDIISAKFQAEELKYTLKKRVKSIESLNAKKEGLMNRGLIQNEKIKDLLGLRFIVPFLEDVEQVIGIVKESFNVVDIERKSEALSYREFAYDSVHMEISLENPDIELPDFCIQSCEIQIRTILQEAWAEIEHELVYKSTIEFPDNLAIRKKIAALNANLVLSDMIFQEIRDKQKELKIWGNERFKELQKKAKEVSVNSLYKYQSVTKEDEWSIKKESKKNIEKYLLKALDAHNAENYRRAIDLYSKALSADPPLKVRAIIYNHRGLAYFMLNKERQALKDFEDSFKCDPRYYIVLNNRALALRRMGLTNEAFYNFDKSLELEEKQPEIYYLRAQTHYEIKNYRSALHDVKIAIALNPDFPEARRLLQQTMEKLSEQNQEQ